jgi:glycosyltransferase involved in cell wall biosynthesis
MLISVCIPTFNRPELLREAVMSCLAQSHRPIEILVGDDGPDERAKAILEAIPPQHGVAIRHMRNEPRLGQAGNVNSLFDAASGERLVLLHDDDLLEPKALAALLECFAKDARVVASFGKQRLMTADGQVLEAQSDGLNQAFFRTAAHARTVLSSLESALVQQFPNDGFMVASRAARAARYPDEHETGNVSWCDFAFGLRLSQHGSFYFLDQFTAKYRITPGSVGVQGSTWAGAFELVERACVPASSQWAKRVAATRIAMRAIREYAGRGDWRRALSLYVSVPPGWRQRLGRSGLLTLLLIVRASLSGRAKMP